jgi:hypothetical protein
MPDDRSRDAVLVAERFADGEAEVEDLRIAHRAAAEVMREVPQRFLGRPQSKRLKSRYGTRVSQRAAGVALHSTNLYFDMRAASRAVKYQSVAARYALSNYLRDLFGNPSP